MAVKWTDQQLAAINTTGRSLLVSAAAGSGKTAVLAERCAYLVCDAPDKCGVDELLVVTFTNAAATEMRDRIERTLRARLESSDDPRLAKQLALIDRAQISTLHGFCSQVLRQYFHVLGVDPNFTQLAEEEAALLRSEVARDLFADRYASEKSGGDFQKFIDQYGNGNDEPLIDRVIRTHNLLASMIDPKAWVNRALGRITAAAQQPLNESELGCELTKLIADGVADLRRRAIDASGRLAEMEGLSHYAEFVNEMLAIVADWQDQFGGGDFDALAASVKTLTLSKLPSVRGLDPALREAGKRIVDSVRDALTGGTVAQLCRFSVAEWRDGLTRIAGPSKIFLDLVLDFSRRYRKEKDELRSIDFSDLERFALKVLRDESNPGLVPTDAARAYQSQFRHVLVDEYQDINAVQDAILSLVSRESLVDSPEVEQNLFCVGDVKQSIYRFRLADPQRFTERGKLFRDGDPRIGQVIDLQSNFRTRGPLIDVINGLFQRLMTEASAEILYDETQMLRAGLEYPDKLATGECFKGAPVELHLLPRATKGESDSTSVDGDEVDLERSEREAVVIAHRIREMMGLTGKPRAKVFVKTDDGLKPREIQYKDIVILLRTMRVKSDDFAEQLRLAGIPVHSDSGTGFFESMEVRDVLSLLHLLDNQRQDIPMAAVLRSPLCKLPNTDDCLAKIALMSWRLPTPIPFHEAVLSYAETQHDELAACLNDFLKQLGAWRTMAHRRPLAELLWTIYDSTGYLAFCAGLDDGEQRVANLIALHERARQFGTFQRQGIGRFMRFIQDLQNQSDLGQPSVASEADDVVRIMSIHRSKGLEFPVVFLPDLGKRHNLRDAHGMILVDRQAYLGMQAVDEDRRIRYPSLAWMLVQDRLKKQMLAEEQRVLYVATTRAREQLILLGTCDETKHETWRATWANHIGALPAEDVLRGNCMLDWIGPAAAAMESAKPGCFTIQSYTDEQLQTLANQFDRRPALSKEQTHFAELQPLNPAPPADAAAQRAIDRLTRVYPWNELATIPAVNSVTGLTKVGRSAPGGESRSTGPVVRFDHELGAPKCVTKQVAASATEVGSATHLALQHLDLADANSVKDILRQLDSLVHRKMMLAGQLKLVDVEAVIWLANGELGKLIRGNRTSVYRELPVYFAEEANTQNKSADPMDRVMIRGRLDVLVQTPDGIVIADYKTDRVTAETVDERAQFYAAQINSYADAINRITGQPIRRAYLAFMSPKILVDLSKSSKK